MTYNSKELLQTKHKSLIRVQNSFHRKRYNPEDYRDKSIVS